MRIPLETSYWAPIDEEPVLATTVASILRNAAEVSPNTTALVEGVSDPAKRRRLTYEAMLSCAEASADRLSTLFGRGERICCFAASTPEALVLSYAAAIAGLVLVPTNPALRHSELAYILQGCEASGVIVGSPFRGSELAAVADDARKDASFVRHVVRLEEVVTIEPSLMTHGIISEREPSPEDIAQLVYTSGTTGLPKGAQLTHSGLTNAARFGAVRFGLLPGDIYLDVMPLHHVGGQVVAFQICQQLATAVLVTGFDPSLVLELLETERVTVTVGVPTMLLALIEHPEFENRDLSALRSVSSGGSVVPPDLVRHIESSLGARSTICFGQTETCGFISQTHLDDSAEDKATTLGQPLPRVEARVVASTSTAAGTEVVEAGDGDEDAAQQATVVGCGEIGELQVRSPFVMVAYHQMPEATEEAFAPGGWLRTGDLVTMDTRGFLRIAGRVKDMIVTGGENVFPVEIETALSEHPDVAIAAVVGVPDHRWGEKVVAVVRMTQGSVTDPSALSAYLATRLAPYKIPKRILFSDDLPLTASGKVQKYKLREQLAATPEDSW